MSEDGAEKGEGQRGEGRGFRLPHSGLLEHVVRADSLRSPHNSALGFDMEAPYTICLSDYEVILPKIADCIGARYETGTFAQVEELFHAERKEKEQWRLQGRIGYIEIMLEKYEGYYFSRFWASEPHFRKGKELLWKRYIAEGGNPDAQQRP